MGRIARRLLVTERSVNHVMWQAHNGERVFAEPAACEKFLELLARYKQRYGVLIFGFCLMGTHPHLLCAAALGQIAWSKFWRLVNHGFACWYNQRHGRKGQVVMERMLSPLVQSSRGDPHALRVLRYIDNNPVAANLARKPSAWRYSSHAHYALGQRHALIDDLPEYEALGSTPAERRKAYRMLFGRRFAAQPSPAYDLERGPFIGDEAWMAAQHVAHGVARPCAASE